MITPIKQEKLFAPAMFVAYSASMFFEATKTGKTERRIA